MNAMIRLVFVDDHGLDRTALAELVEARVGMRVLARVGKPETARVNDPELTIVDLRQEQRGGLALVCELRSAEPPVVFFALGEPDGERATMLQFDVCGQRLDGVLRQRDNPLWRLTERERQVLDHVVLGSSNKSIARTLAISHDTVKLHVRHILSKLDVATRVEAAVLAAGMQTAPPVDPRRSHAARAAARLALGPLASRA